MSFDGYLKSILSKFGEDSLKFSKNIAVGSASIVISGGSENYTDPFSDAILHEIVMVVIFNHNGSITTREKAMKRTEVVKP